MVRREESSERGVGQTVRLTPEVERTLRRYVLGDLEEELRGELEELLITDPDAFEALGVIEDELIEEYLDETGSQAERRGFEQHFLHGPQGIRRVRFARTLKDLASTPTPRLQVDTRPRGGRVARPVEWRRAWVGLAAALAVSLIGSPWLVWLYRGQHQEDELPVPRPGHHQEEELPVPRPAATPSDALAAAAARPPLPSRPLPAPPAPRSPALVAATPTPSMQTGESTAELNDRVSRLAASAEALARKQEEQLHRSGARVATFSLTAGLQRAEGPLPRVSVPADAVGVGLRLELPQDDYPGYRAALLDADGKEIWVASNLRAEAEPGHATVVLALLPASLLPGGDYQMKLSGVSEG
jgi:hypothetical protein